MNFFEVSWPYIKKILVKRYYTACGANFCFIFVYEHLKQPVQFWAETPSIVIHTAQGSATPSVETGQKGLPGHYPNAEKSWHNGNWNGKNNNFFNYLNIFWGSARVTEQLHPLFLLNQSHSGEWKFMEGVPQGTIFGSQMLLNIQLLQG